MLPFVWNNFRIERLIMKVREEVTIGAASFKRPTDMLSSPLALFKGRLLMKLKELCHGSPVYFV